MSTGDETWRNRDRDSESRSSTSSDFSQESDFSQANPMNVSGAAAGNTPQPNAVIGADLRNVIGTGFDNVVAIAAQQNFMNSMSGIKNNLDTLALKYYYGIDMIGVQDEAINYLNGSGSDTTAPSAVNVINSSTGNVQNNVDYEANAAIFKIIKESIASETETKNWDTKKGKDAHRARVAGTSFTSAGLGALNKELNDALAEAGKKGVKTIPKLKLADISDPCTQIVFGYTRGEDKKIQSATGRIQAFTAGPGSSASVGSFSMEIKDGKYVITVGGDSSQTLLVVIGNLIGVNPKDIVVQQLVEKQDTTVVDASGAGDGDASSSASNVGGKRKTKRRKHKTLRSKAKKHRKTSKKHVKSHKKSHKKGKKH